MCKTTHPPREMETLLTVHVTTDHSFRPFVTFDIGSLIGDPNGVPIRKTVTNTLLLTVHVNKEYHTQVYHIALIKNIRFMFLKIKIYNQTDPLFSLAIKQDTLKIDLMMYC